MAIDNPDDRTGPRSSAAHAEAAAALRSQDLQAGFKAETAILAAGGEPESDDPEPEVETPMVEREAGPTPPPTPEGEDEPANEDYDEEELAEIPEAERPEVTETEPAKETKPAGEDPDRIEKTWEQYKTDDERKKALAESKRYAIAQAEENKRLKAELEASRKPKEDAPAPKAPEPPVEPKVRFETAVHELHAKDEAFRAEFVKLKETRDSITARTNEIAALGTETATREKDLERERYHLDFLQANLKADPDNFETQKRVEETERKIVRLETSINSDKAKQIRMQLELERWQHDYQTRGKALTDYTAEYVRRSDAEAQANAQRGQQQEAAEKEWTETLPKVLDELKIDADPEVRDDIAERLLLKAQLYFDRGGAPIKDLAAWMRQNVETVAKVHTKVRENATRRNVELLKKDATINGPKGRDAVVTPPRKERLSSREADRVAQQAARNWKL
jgi:hypothetical protein